MRYLGGWNTQTAYSGNPLGDWVQYQTDLLATLGPTGCDGISIHAYTHGADPSLIHTDAFMNPPFSHRQYNAWQNVNRGWIQRAYGEIEWWNRQPDTQVIRALILYRWPNVDRWGLEGKTALYEDFRQAMTHNYNWEAAMTAKPSTPPQPPAPPPASTGVAQPAFVETHSPGMQWLEGACYKDKLLSVAAAVSGSPIQPPAQLLAELKAEIERLKAQVAVLSGQVNQLGADKAALAGQLQTLQAQNATLTQQAKTLTDANNALKEQLKAAEADKQALHKRIAELEARIAELTKGQGKSQVPAPAVRNIISTLPQHTTNRYNARLLSAINTLVIHHSAAGSDIPPQNVAAYHVRKDWPGMGYHYYIMEDGTIYQCNKLETVSYHVGYGNPYSIGICLAGRFMDGTTPPDKQLAAHRAPRGLLVTESDGASPEHQGPQGDARNTNRLPRQRLGRRQAVERQVPWAGQGQVGAVATKKPGFCHAPKGAETWFLALDHRVRRHFGVFTHIAHQVPEVLR